MSESAWLLILMVWFLFATVSLAGCLSESDTWSDISMCAFMISIGIMECFMVSTWTW